ncbi:carbohydrate ABC transporter permease [Caproiciproducens sp. NJN-50]|uniref:carbohydrate ABC transporter permease n=1 Tax=Caproiciproducens sp. NJN-50 TaxID=2507162 RepID=UPI001FA98F95|nr:sugar ABC transporter permease [Caproiciproducens sp. NJN-50]
MMKNKSAGRRLPANTADIAFSLTLSAPAMLMTIVFILFPVVDSVYKSLLTFKVSNIISGKPGTWNNFQNYIRLFQNNKLVPSIITTFSFVAVVVIFQFVLGMSLALILNSSIRGSRFLRSVMMIPWVVPTVISALVWMWIYQPQYGLLKYFVSLMGINDFAILNNPSTALWGVVVAALWKQIPLTTLLLLAGLQNVPSDMLEAATVDGASGARRFFSVVFPSMKSVVKITLTMAIIENFKQFPLVWTMTGGGPQDATTTLAILSYREAFVSNNFGSGAAVTTVWMFLMMIVVFFYNKFMGSSDVD